ncbi:MAG: isoleucine--tRNA ligase [Planctomycetes bacterium]|nr:isoleucine--tRNA ligase [Planctomycetota bacterium]
MVAGNYKETILTPKTDFPMRAGLVKNEPKMQARWAEQGIYQQIREARAGQPVWVLHDGPPYANGDLHMGHVLNKVLKDIVVKLKTMEGLDSPYIPGWDCHGLPIEHQVMTSLGDKLRDPGAPGPLAIRKLCRKHAEKFIEVQSKQFQQLGVFGQFDKPYLTMSPQYEADTLEVFAKLVEQDLVYRQLKPVHWCIDCRTALAEAELEYQDRKDTSIFVNFPVTDDTRAKLGDLPKDAAVSFMIWTTTPWTLPANMAIAVHPDFQYQLVSYALDGKPQASVIAEGLVDYVMQAGGVSEFQKLRSFKGSDLVGCSYNHAFIDRTSPILAADYVTLKDEKGNPTGTGLVHTAPGHGADDYHTGQKNNIEIYSPVLDDGTFDDTVPDWIQGKSVWAGNKIICAHLVQSGHMFHQNEFVHSYPHCWRSKTPTVFRCTEQWFVSVDKQLPTTNQSLRKMALEASKSVRWIPEWGRTRIESMLNSRPDWCLSRQRVWGLPIPAFYDKNGDSVISPQIVRAVADHFRKHGSDSWFTDSPEKILGDCPLPNGLSAADLSPEHDIFDVWFESGSSWAAVCQAEGWDMPVELYLEGSDQHRGWFQLSLLPALGAMQQAPFKTVLTHGFIVDDHGRKMSKSAGNVVDPQKEIQKYGTDVIRLWVASIDYQNDIRCSDALISSLQDEYRKVRNTIRFLLGAIHGFDPQQDAVEIDQNSIDAWARLRLHQLVRDVNRLFGDYAFYKVFKRIHDFCNLDMSQVYFVALKDRLYCDKADSRRRRRSQTVLHEIADNLIRLIAPILIYTAEEAWGYLPARSEDVDSVHLAHYPKPDPKAFIKQVEEEWDFILKLREDAMLQLDTLKREQGMTNPLDAQAVYYVNEAQEQMLARHDEEPADVLGVGSYKTTLTNEEPRIVIQDVRDKYEKCARSWKRRPDVGSDPDHPDLSKRDAMVMTQLARTP